MGSFSGLGIGLSFLFGCVVLGFVAELYYLLWWKKQRQDIENQNLSSSNYTPTHLSSCFKTPNSSNTHQKDLQNCVNEIENQEKQQDSTQKDPPLNLKGFGEESLDLELMRLHNLCGPPRFLFTINEETKEDLESDSRKGSRTRSLSELLCTPETPRCCLSPLKGPQASNLEGYLNPLYDSNEFELNKVRSSPPPTFKFLRDAEEKLLRKLMELEAEKRANLKKIQDGDCSRKTEDKDCGVVKVKGNMVNCQGGIHHHHLLQMSASSQVLPLSSSPSK